MILTFFTESAKINTMHNNFLENLPIILHNFQKMFLLLPILTGGCFQICDWLKIGMTSHCKVFSLEEY